MEYSTMVIDSNTNHPVTVKVFSIKIKWSEQDIIKSMIFKNQELSNKFKKVLLKRHDIKYIGESMDVEYPKGYNIYWD